MKKRNHDNFAASESSVKKYRGIVDNITSYETKNTDKSIEELIHLSKTIDQQTGVKSKKSKKSKKRILKSNHIDAESSNSTCQVTITLFDSSQDDKSYPYQISDDDHCETPLEAYQDICNILEEYAKSINKTRESLIIYDPYFCEGSMIERLKDLGFYSVYNKKEDFYQQIQLQQIPTYDVLVTNPPYSNDHISQLLQFCISSNKPWFLLVPNYVYLKDFYVFYISNIANQGELPFYIAPKKRYLYSTPKGRRQQKSAKYTSPFPTFWYCCCPTLRKRAYNLCNTEKCDISFNSPSNLPLIHLPDSDPKKKKMRNALKRKKNKGRKKSNTNDSTVTSN